MKINKLINKILFLYFFIFSVLFTALYLIMSFEFNIGYYMFFTILNILPSAFIIIISGLSIYKNSNVKKVTNNNCDNIYWYTKNIPFIIYLINIIIPILILVIIRQKASSIISLLNVFSSTVFYIFSQTYFKDILEYSEKHFRANISSIAYFKKKNIFSNIPFSINILFELIPLLITIFVLAFCFEINISSIIFLASLLIISVLSIIYIALIIYYNINSISKELKKPYITQYNGEFGNLAFQINATKQIYNDYIEQIQNIQNIQLEKERLASIEILRRTVDAKDTYTRGHSDRVSEYSVLIGKKLELSNEDLQLLKIGGLFHDIGKIGIPDNLLLKNSKLTTNEYNQIKQHTVIGAHILENSTIFENILPIVLYHHERYDGYGYPHKLKGEEIPFLARIVAVADTFDAMTSKRTYRNALPLDIVKLEFEKCSGTQFDPKISKMFINILNNEIDKIDNIKNIYK